MKTYDIPTLVRLLMPLTASKEDAAQTRQTIKAIRRHELNELYDEFAQTLEHDIKIDITAAKQKMLDYEKDPILILGRMLAIDAFNKAMQPLNYEKN